MNSILFFSPNSIFSRSVDVPLAKMHFFLLKTDCQRIEVQELSCFTSKQNKKEKKKEKDLLLGCHELLSCYSEKLFSKICYILVHSFKIQVFHC